MIVIIRQLLNDDYERTAKAAVRLIEKIEDRYGFDSHIKEVYCRPSSSLTAVYYSRNHYRLPGVMRIPCLPPRSRQLKEFVYHEIGHSILDNYRIRSVLKRFTKRKSDGWQYIMDTFLFSRQTRQPGFVSGYAGICAEEDFCESLSAFLCSGGRDQKSIRYDGNNISLKSDPRLRRKLAVINQLLKRIG